MTDLTPQQVTAARLTEYRALIEIEGYQRRTRRYMHGTIETDRVAEQTRRLRLTELVDLLQRDNVTCDVDTDAEAWVDTHPLTMTGAGMKRVIDSTTGQGNGVSVAVQIGDPAKGGRYYQLHEGQFVKSNGLLVLELPDAIAEDFRQQGRRAACREIRKALGL